MRDALVYIRYFRTFNVVNTYNFDALAIEIDLNLHVPRFIRAQERLTQDNGNPN